MKLTSLRNLAVVLACVGGGVAASGHVDAASHARLAGSPCAPAPNATYRFVPVRLTTYDIEDWWPDWQDEIAMYYGDQVFTASTWNGSVVYPGATTFTGTTLKVDLWERDNGWTNHNLLGSVTVSNTNLCLERTQTFLRPGDYHYELVYRVERVRLTHDHPPPHPRVCVTGQVVDDLSCDTDRGLSGCRGPC